jgi:hypothetical protein
MLLPRGHHDRELWSRPCLSEIAFVMTYDLSDGSEPNHARIYRIPSSQARTRIPINLRGCVEAERPNR